MEFDQKADFKALSHLNDDGLYEIQLAREQSQSERDFACTQSAVSQRSVLEENLTRTQKMEKYNRGVGIEAIEFQNVFS